MFLDLFDHHHLAAAQASRFGEIFAALESALLTGTRGWRGGSSFVGGIGSLFGACAGLVGKRGLSAGSEDFPFTQGKDTALKVRNAAASEVLVNHPQVHIVHRLEQTALHCLVGQAVLLADAVAVMSVDQHIAPQDEGIAAPLRQNAAFQSGMLLGGKRVNIGFEFFVDDDVHTGCAYAKGLDCRCWNSLGLGCEVVEVLHEGRSQWGESLAPKVHGVPVGLHGKPLHPQHSKALACKVRA